MTVGDGVARGGIVVGRVQRYFSLRSSLVGIVFSVGVLRVCCVCLSAVPCRADEGNEGRKDIFCELGLKQYHGGQIGITYEVPEHSFAKKHPSVKQPESPKNPTES